MSTGTITSGEGRAVKLSSSGDISFSGNMPLSDVSITISEGVGNGFNLIGNPFPSYMPANNTTPTVSNNILSANSGILNQQTIWFWDQSSTRYVAINQASALIEGNRFIAPGQGFFVESNEVGGSFTFAESMQSHQSTDVFAKQNINVPKIKLYISGNSTQKETNILYLPYATKGWDNGFDSTLFDGVNTDFAIYTHLVNNSQGQNLEIQSLPDNNYESMVIPVGVNARNGSSITITADVSDLPVGIDVYLEDREQNTFIKLSETGANYTISLSSDLQGIGRFYLHTTSKTLKINTQELDNVSVYMTNPNNLRITGINRGKVTLELYSIEGKQIQKNQFIAIGVNDISLSKISTGIYIVKLQNEHGKLTKKIIKK